MKTLRCFSWMLLLSLLPALLYAAPTRETRTVGPFTKLGLANSVRVVLRQGSPQRVEVEGEAADLARLETVVEGGKLRVQTKREGRMNWSDSKFSGPVTVYVTVPTIDELSVSGSGRVDADSDLKADALELSVSGSGTMTLPKLTASKLRSAVSGSGTITVAGTCPQHEARISGSGDVRATDLRTETSAIRISGSGNGRLYASRTLDASIAGSGDVYVRGGAQVSSKIAGSGRVRKE